MLQHVLSHHYMYHQYLLLLFSHSTNFSKFSFLLDISSLCCKFTFSSTSHVFLLGYVLSCHSLYHQFLFLLVSHTTNFSKFSFLLDISSLSSSSLVFVLQCVLSCHYLYYHYLLLLFSHTAKFSKFSFLLDISSLCCNVPFSSPSLVSVLQHILSHD